MRGRSSEPENNAAKSNQTIWERLSNGSEDSSSSSPFDTPLSTPFTFGAQRTPSPSFAFQARTPPHGTSDSPQTMKASATRFTRSPTRSSSSKERAMSRLASDETDPDTPLPSVESDTRSSDDRGSSAHTVSTTSSTHSASTIPAPTENDVVQDQLGMLRNLRLSSVPVIPPTRSSSTPSIQVTPSEPESDHTRSRVDRSDSLVGGVHAMRLDSSRAETPRAASPGEHCSPSPSRRRRSGSAVNNSIHEVENEELPEALAHVPKAHNALAKTKTLASDLAKVLSSSYMHLDSGSSIAKLHQQAIKLSAYELPSSRIVGLVGDSGVGKSSLINSLLDHLDLARASGNGTACTCAVTEYIFHDRDDFIVEVDFFPLDELRKQFEELLDAYRDFHSQTRNSKDTNNANDNNESEMKILERKAALAIETFQASFKERLNHEPSVLASMPIERAVGKMLEWASRVVPARAIRDTFSTREACATRLRELTSESSLSRTIEQTNTSWPFIRKLRVYLKAYILSKGLIIADLPGLRDLNSTRKAITERHIRQCHQVFVVARIDRAITDASIKEIFELAGRANLSKVDIICTRAEDIQIREAKHDWPEERSTIEEIQQQISADDDELRSLNEEIEEYEQDLENLTHEEKTELINLQSSRSKVRKSKQNLQFKLTSLIITTRKGVVCDRLRAEYRDNLSRPDSQIFCVSNSMYWDKRNESKEAALPYLRLSGILELRCYCIGIVAQSRLRATREFIKDEVPALLGSIQLWIEAGSGNGDAERKQRTLNTVSNIQQELNMLKPPNSELSDISLASIFYKRICRPIAQNGAKWATEARNASSIWSGWHHSSYKAFCSNYGDHSTKAVGYRCWNEEAICGMRTDISPAWKSMKADVEENHVHMNTVVNDLFDRMLQLTTNEDVDPANPTRNTAVQALARVIRHRKDLTLYGIEAANDTLLDRLATLRTDSISSVRTAFIGNLMEDTYHAANMESGGGSHVRRATLITSRFGSIALFKELRTQCSEQFGAIAAEFQENVNTTIDEQVSLIESSLQMLRDKNVVLESEKNPEFRRRLDKAATSINKELDKVAQLVEITI